MIPTIDGIYRNCTRDMQRRALRSLFASAQYRRRRYGKHDEYRTKHLRSALIIRKLLREQPKEPA